MEFCVVAFSNILAGPKKIFVITPNLQGIIIFFMLWKETVVDINIKLIPTDIFKWPRPSDIAPK